MDMGRTHRLMELQSALMARMRARLEYEQALRRAAPGAEVERMRSRYEAATARVERFTSLSRSPSRS